MKKVCLSILFLFPIIFTLAQKFSIDSVKKELASSKSSNEIVQKLIEIGNFYLEENPDSSLFYANKASTFVNSNLSADLKFESTMLKVRALNQLKKYDNTILELKKFSPGKIKDKLKKGRYFYEKGFALYYLGQNEHSMQLLDSAKFMFSELNASTDLAMLNRLLALNCWSKGDYGNGLIHINKSVAVLEALNDSLKLATSLNTKGAILWGLANFEEALDCFYSALIIEEKQQTRYGKRIILYNNIGMVHSDWGNLDEAFIMFQKAENLLEFTDNETSIAYTNLNLGTYYMQIADYEKATRHLNIAQTIYGSINDVNGVSLCKIRKGQCFNQQKDFEKARDILESAIEDSKISKNQHRRGTALYHLAKNELAIGTISVAEKYNKEAIELAQTGKYKDILYLLYIQAAELAEFLKNYETSISYYKKANVEKDEIYREKTALQHEIIDVILDNNRKEFENARLKDQNKNREKTIMYGAIFIVIIVILLFAISVNSYVLSKKKKELLLANHTKDKIFSIVAHDLRGPVGSLNHFIDLMITDDFETDYKSILSRFKPVIASSFSMLENLLVWAKSNLGKLEIAKEKVYLNKIINDTVILLSKIANEKDIKITFLTTENIYVWSDLIILQSVLRNLLSNAVKFSQTNGLIEISANVLNGQCVVQVSDNGLGIPAEIKDQIFTGTFHTPGTNNEKGSGLGLVLSKELIEKNGGTIWFKPNKKQGTSFFFSIALAQ